MSRDQSSLFSHGVSPGKAIEEDLPGTLALWSVEGVGSARFRALLKAFGGPVDVFKATEKSICSVPGVDTNTAAAISQTSPDGTGEKLLEKLQSCGASVVSIWDERYPHRLKEIHDPPALLFVRGSLPDVAEKCIAIVGTRTPTAYGISQGHSIAEQLAARGVGVVSGMARGIDSSAHGGALQANGRTYAVFGCGIDRIYPTENKSLAEKIESNGALISEFLPGVKPDARFFPRRNRIISGLSEAVLVVQGGRDSGALITAKFALDQNRDVFALPGNVEDRRSVGPHMLIKEGAGLVTCADDILQEINLSAIGEAGKDVSTPLPKLNASEEAVAKYLSFDPIHIDQLTREMDIPVNSVLADLLGLEMKGWVVQLPGKMFAIKKN
ncbi:DNA-protecting protein DprA [candidate division LCP-89 bacterium B3_LCP]|uniref:DNA-protecting protein DprA n=1 Tax=candidate division LCP-89 bacterium B3_LCP TaxID=2012998 RepID=A0A532UXQ8_UNCL8|nr:MAG: DNA-protecting protein DprA [candidate division LCP-89 bacterium B3_LCP]